MMNGPQHMRTNNFILKNTGCLSKEYCKDLINFFDKNESIAEKGIAGSKRLNDLEIAIDVHQFSDDLLIGLNDTIDKYKKKYPLIDTQLDRWQIDKIAQLMRYEPNNVYSYIHCETGPHNPYRIFAWMIYLNTIKDGGGTEFLHFNKTLIPKAGDMYIWPAGWTHLHRGVVAPKERKYLLTGWVSHLR